MKTVIMVQAQFALLKSYAVHLKHLIPKVTMTLCFRCGVDHPSQMHHDGWRRKNPLLPLGGRESYGRQKSAAFHLLLFVLSQVSPPRGLHLGNPRGPTSCENTKNGVMLGSRPYSSWNEQDRHFNPRLLLGPPIVPKRGTSCVIVWCHWKSIIIHSFDQFITIFCYIFPFFIPVKLRHSFSLVTGPVTAKNPFWLLLMTKYDTLINESAIFVHQRKAAS